MAEPNIASPYPPGGNTLELPQVYFPAPESASTLTIPQVYSPGPGYGAYPPPPPPIGPVPLLLPPSSPGGAGPTLAGFAAEALPVLEALFGALIAELVSLFRGSTSKPAPSKPPAKPAPHAKPNPVHQPGAGAAAP